MKKYKKMPEIDLDQFKLRTIKLSDYKDMFEYGRDIEVTKWLSWGPMKHPFEARKSIKQIFFPRVKRGLPIGYAIIDKANDKMIGTIDFHAKLDTRNAAEIGYCLHRAYWSKGIMTKALHKMIDIGFHYLDYDVIIVKHLEDNVGSMKVIMKNGFKLIKRTPYTFPKESGRLEGTLLHYELNKEDYDGN